MYAQLGRVIFEPLYGFKGVQEKEEVNVAVYGRAGRKGLPDVVSFGLRELSITVGLHQVFVNVGLARGQLTGHMQGGEVVSLVWGNGDVEGRFLIKGLETVYEQQLGDGTVVAVSMSVSLLEAGDDMVFEAVQADARKAAFVTGRSVTNPWLYGDKRFVRPVAGVRPRWAVWLGYVQKGVRLAAMVDALAYGGKFPNLGSNLTQILANLDVNMGLMYDWWGDDLEIDDIRGDIDDVRDGITALQGFAVVGDWVGFGVRNRAWQVICGRVWF